jgi:hypothetical protein
MIIYSIEVSNAAPVEGGRQNPAKPGTLSSGCPSTGLCQVKREVVRISFVHHFKAQISTVISLPWDSTTDWLKLRPFRLKAIVEMPSEVNQMPTTGQNARKKCSERELLKDAYWKISRPK